MLIRPLLGWRKQELAAIVAASGLEPLDDPSNRSPRFDRSRVRAWLTAAESRQRRACCGGGASRGLRAALAWAADAAWRLRASVGEEILVEPAGLPRELRRRLARRAIEQVRGAAGLKGPWREDGLDRLLATLDGGGAATLAGVACRGGAGWTFRPAPPRRA